MTLEELYEIAQSENIDIYAAALPLTQSMSIMDDDLNCYIGIDYDQIHTNAEEKRKLAHEIGHCIKGAFYNRYSKLDLISKHEYSADKWACEKLLPKDEMQTAFLRYGSSLSISTSRKSLSKRLFGFILIRKYSKNGGYYG